MPFDDFFDWFVRRSTRESCLTDEPGEDHVIGMVNSRPPVASSGVKSMQSHMTIAAPL